MVGIAHTGSISEVGHYLSYGSEGNDNRVEDRSKRVGWESGRNLGLTSTVERATDQMRDTIATKAGEIEDEVYHIILSWESGNEKGVSPDRPTREEMEASVDRMLEELGLDEHQAWIFRHIDTDTPHVHAMVSRVHPTDRTVWSADYDQTIVYETCRKLEEEHGWHRPAPMTIKEKHKQNRPSSPKYWETQVGDRSVRVQAQQDGLRDRIKEATSWPEVERAAEEHKAELVPKENGGMVLRKNGTHVAMSSIDPTISRPQLEQRISQTRQADSDQ